MEESAKPRKRRPKVAERPATGGSAETPARTPAKKRSGEPETVSDVLYWSYACLAAATAGEQAGITTYDTRCWMIRARLFKGLREGRMKVGTLFADVRDMPTDRCVYCGTTPPPKLHGDHLIPRNKGGPESGDNLVWACRSCNSSKNARDLLEWYASKQQFPPLLLMRRYLKLAIAEAETRQVMNAKLADRPVVTFSIDHIPMSYPQPGALRGPNT